jgi:hypothetical protein
MRKLLGWGMFDKAYVLRCVDFPSAVQYRNTGMCHEDCDRLVVDIREVSDPAVMLLDFNRPSFASPSAT